MGRPRKRYTIALGRPATWDDLLEVPEDFIGEIVSGELVATPLPSISHASVASDMAALIGGPFRLGLGGPGGWMFLSKPRIRFSDDIRVPDIAGWRRDRFNGPEMGPIVVAPDWIGEVLSPSTEADDRGPKMDTYHRGGVHYLWLIGWQTRMLEAYRRKSEGWLRAGVFIGDARIRAEPFDAVELDPAPVWAILPPVPTDEP